jgi:hypothetical protein
LVLSFIVSEKNRKKMDDVLALRLELDSPFLIAPFGILSRLLISFLLFLHCVIWPRKHFPVLSSFMTYRRVLTRVTWMAPLSNLLSSHLYSCHVIENYIWIEPLLIGHLSYKATFYLSHRWPLYTGLIVLYYVYCSVI